MTHNPYRTPEHIQTCACGSFAKHDANAQALDELRAAIDASGLSVGQYAKRLIRSRRTVFRWIAGDSPIPKSVRDFVSSELTQMTQPATTHP